MHAYTCTHAHACSHTRVHTHVHTSLYAHKFTYIYALTSTRLLVIAARPADVVCFTYESLSLSTTQLWLASQFIAYIFFDEAQHLYLDACYRRNTELLVSMLRMYGVSTCMMSGSIPHTYRKTIGEHIGLRSGYTTYGEHELVRTCCVILSQLKCFSRF